MSRERSPNDAEGRPSGPDGRRRGAGCRQSGFALVLALWVLTALSILLLTLSIQVRTNVRAASYLRDQLQTEQLARGAIARVALELADEAAERPDGAAGLELGEERPGSTPEDSGLSPVRHLGTWRVDPADWSVSARPTDRRRFRRADADVGELIVEVSAEDAKLPLGRFWEAAADDLGLPRPAAELVLVDDLLAWGDVPDRRVRRLIEELYPLVTTFSDGRVFLNGASRAVLERIPGLDERAVDRLLDHRERHGPFTRFAAVGDVLGVEDADSGSYEGWLTLSARYYALRVDADAAGVLEGVARVDGERAELVSWRKRGAE